MKPLFEIGNGYVIYLPAAKLFLAGNETFGSRVASVWVSLPHAARTTHTKRVATRLAKSLLADMTPGTELAVAFATVTGEELTLTEIDSLFAGVDA